MSWADGQTIDDPTITIDGIDFTDASRSATFSAEDDEVSDPTFNGPKNTRPGATKWTATVNMQLTYGTAQIADGSTSDAGTWNTLNAMRKLRKPIVLGPSQESVAVDAPTATFNAYIGTITFMDGETAASETQSVEVMLHVRGEPTFATS